MTGTFGLLLFSACSPVKILTQFCARSRFSSTSGIIFLWDPLTTAAVLATIGRATAQRVKIMQCLKSLTDLKAAYAGTLQSGCCHHSFGKPTFAIGIPWFAPIISALCAGALRRLEMRVASYRQYSTPTTTATLGICWKCAWATLAVGLQR